jgi:hypothetical protein
MNDTVNSDVVQAEELSINTPAVAEMMRNDKEIRAMKPEMAEQAAIDKINSTENESEEAAPTPKKDDSNLQKKGKLSAEERISEVTRARREAEKRADTAEQRLKELEGSKVNNESEQVETKVNSTPEVKLVLEKFSKEKPNLETYTGSLADFQEELVDWKLEKREWDTQQKHIEQQIKAEGKKVENDYTNRENAYKLVNAEFEGLINPRFQQDFVDKIASPAALGFIIESKVGPEILFELASDEAKLAGFKAMTPVKQVAYISKLEARFEDVTTENTATNNGNRKGSPVVSKVRPPDTRLPKSSGVVRKELPANPSFSEYQAWRKK